MNHKELTERIERLTREEEMKKQTLETGFSTFKKQLMPGQIAKRVLRNGLQKVKNILPHFGSRHDRNHTDHDTHAHEKN